MSVWETELRASGLITTNLNYWDNSIAFIWGSEEVFWIATQYFK